MFVIGHIQHIFCYSVSFDLLKSELTSRYNLVKFMHVMLQCLDDSGQVSGEEVPWGRQSHSAKFSRAVVVLCRTEIGRGLTEGRFTNRLHGSTRRQARNILHTINDWLHFEPHKLVPEACPPACQIRLAHKWLGRICGSIELENPQHSGCTATPPRSRVSP